MGAFFALILILAPAVAAPSAPPVIIEVHSKSTVCAAIQKQIGPVVAALLQNNRTIEDGVYSMQQIEADGGRYWLDIDKLHLENDVSKIVRNLQATKSLLAQPDLDGTSPADSAQVAAMKARLNKVADEQWATLNALDGLLETVQMNQLMNSSAIPDFSQPEIVQGLSASGIQGAGGQAPTAAAIRAAGNTPADNSDNPIVRNAVQSFPSLQRAESQAAQVIIPAANSCDRLTAPPKNTP